MARNHSYEVAVAMAVLFGVSVLIGGNVTPFAFASPSSAGDQGAAKLHLGEAIKALQAGDTAGAKMHAQFAQDSL
jgi:hypothetical protein